MSNFIIPLSSLPTVSSIDRQAPANTAATVTSGLPFADYLQNALGDMVQAGDTARSSTYSLAMGASDDLHTGAIDSLKYSTAVNFASGLTSSVIKAYNELIKMQI